MTIASIISAKVRRLNPMNNPSMPPNSPVKRVPDFITRCRLHIYMKPAHGKDNSDFDGKKVQEAGIPITLHDVFLTELAVVVFTDLIN